MAELLQADAQTTTVHPAWVRVSHWILAASVLTLVFSGFAILMVHPRLYWGEGGNDLTPALVELPISRNHQHGGWTERTAITADPRGPVSANRTYDIFNQNGWARSLHFLAAWILVLPGLVYLLTGLAEGHFRERFLPVRGELTTANLLRDLSDHLRFRMPVGTAGSRYGLLQKLTYALIVFAAAPLVVLTGLTMSPAVTASVPILLRVFGGYQSARTIHFVAFVALVLFVVAHVVMVVRTGFRRQMRAMTTGG